MDAANMSMLAYRDIWEKTAVLKPRVKQTRKGCMKWKTTEKSQILTFTLCTYEIKQGTESSSLFS